VTVRFKLVYPVVFVLLGVFDLVMGFFAVEGYLTGGGSARTSTTYYFFAFAVVTVVCAAQWNRGYFEFDPGTGSILIRRAFGAGKRFGGAGGGLLFVDSGAIFCTTASGARKRVPVTRFLARAEQWNAVLEQIRRASVTGPAPL
jgi:hypothetical protein